MSCFLLILGKCELRENMNDVKISVFTVVVVPLGRNVEYMVSVKSIPNLLLHVFITDHCLINVYDCHQSKTSINH